MNTSYKIMVAASLLAASITTQALPVTLDFDSLSTGSIAEGSLGNADVSFDNTGGSAFQVQSCSLLADFSCGNAILNNPYSNTGNSTIATFSSTSSFVSVVIGDYGTDADNLYLNAYDALNNLLGSDFFANPSSNSGGHTLSVSAANISYVEFYGVGVSNNSVYWDEFTYDLAANPVAAPSSIALLGLGLAGLGFARRKTKA